MSKTFFKSRGYSLTLIIVIASGAMLLAGCSVGGGQQASLPDSPAPAKKQSAIIPVAKADYKEGEFQAFKKDSFDKAVSDNKTVFLDFHADWCEVCRGNEPIIESVFKQEVTDEVVGFKVDYDKESDLKKALKVANQSTLILLEGNREVRRVMGPQQEDDIKGFITGKVITMEKKVDSVAVSENASYEAGIMQEFDEAKFASAQGNEEVILLDFHADWCHVCRDNEPVIREGLKSGNDVVAFKVDYDTASKLKKDFEVLSQSTLILLQGDQELNRAVGPQNSETIGDFLAI
jgi:thiol:disulfide interchange protein